MARVGSLLVAAVVALVLTVGSAGTAQAHNSLRSTEPAAGATLAEPPTQVVLTFDGDVLDVGTAVELTGPAGRVTLAPLQVAGPVVTQPLPADLPAGDYRAMWRVTSSDGHPVDGVLTFAVAASAAGAAGATATGGSPSGPASQPGAAAATPPPSASPAQATTNGSTERSDGGSGGFPPLVWGLGALAVVVVVAASWYGATRRHGR